MYLVAKKPKLRSPVIPARPYSFSHNGCVRHRLGSPRQRQGDPKELVNSSKTLAYKQKRIIRNLCDSSFPKKTAREHTGVSSDGQPNSHLIHPKSRWHKICSHAGADDKASRTKSYMEHNLNCSLHSERLQLHSRQPVTPKTSTGLAHLQRSSGYDLQEMGNTSSGPIRIQSIEGSANLRIQGLSGPRSTLHKCFQQTMGFHTGLSISTALPCSTSSQTSQSGEGNIYINSTEMGKGLLACRPKVTYPGTASSNSESRESSNRCVDKITACKSSPSIFGGLEDTGWSGFLTNWQKEDIDLLENSWRKTSLKTYWAPWREWTQWARTRNILLTDPSPAQVAQYLGYLHRTKKLAPSTIKLHKSVIATFANPLKSDTISKDPFVKRMLKAIDISKPPVNKKLIWDVNKLILWLMEEKIDESSLFQVSRRVAIILLLASGRRIHDLTLLRIDKDNMAVTADYVRFWPEYGSKTDKSCYRQSGWQLNKGSERALDPVFWIQKLIEVTRSRRSARDSLYHLFITSRGTVRAASRTVIAGWVKTAFQVADISFPPGSIRSAVASARWKNNTPLDTILKNGNWQGKENFFKHYYKEISSSSPVYGGLELTQNTFCPI